MGPMIKQIYVPADLGAGEIIVTDIRVQRGSRIRHGEILLLFTVNGQERPYLSKYNGWVRMVVVRVGQVVRPGELLMLIDTVEPADYRPDGSEFNQKTELGGQGRRELERTGEAKFGEGFSAPLFDAPERGEGKGNQMPQNPLMQNMKEGVPPKMQASAANNQPAIDKLSEDASNDPELRKQLSMQLQQELSITPSPTIAPTPRVGG